MLRAMRLPPRVVEEAVTKARGHHYQLACTAAFQGQHSCICESGISHPNQVMRDCSDCFLLDDVVPASELAGTQGDSEWLISACCSCPSHARS